MFFSNHARSVTILCRGDALEKSMSRYLIDQLATRSEHPTCSRHARSPPRTARRSLEAIDVARPRDRRDDPARLAAALFIFIGADAETGWLPPEIALDQPRLRAHRPRRARRGRWTLDRDPYLLETSVPGIFACGDVRSGPVKRVAAAVGEGSMAIAFVHQYLSQVESAAAAGSSGA